MKQAFTTNEVAEILGCDIQRVQLLIRAGKLAAINIAVGEKKARYRVPQAALDQFLTPTNCVMPKPVATRKRTRIDAGVEKVFG